MICYPISDYVADFLDTCLLLEGNASAATIAEKERESIVLSEGGGGR